MSEHEIEATSPRVRAALAKDAREAALAEVNESTKGRKFGEVSHLRNIAKHIDSALDVYDLLDDPPPIASDYTALFDATIVRLRQIAVEPLPASGRSRKG